jgi:glyoxylase-like metal-dependent hydrolase (beta-lactamase superfamily II)
MEIVMRVHAIETGKVKIKTAQLQARRLPPGSLIDIFTDPNWTDWVPTYAWAIETDEGVIVVDSGQATYLLEAVRRSFHPYVRFETMFQIAPEQEVGPQLKALGIGQRDVRKLVLTHLHIDHDAGIGHFPASEILAAPGEIGRARGMAGMLRGYLPQRWPAWFDPKGLVLDDGAYGPFGASKRLTADGRVVAVATPGHTPDHLSVIVDDGDVCLFLAGDTSYTQDLMLAGEPDGVSQKPEVARATLAAIRQFASERPTVYLPAHDPQAGMRFANRQTVPVQGSRGAV